MNITDISLEALENALSAAGESHHDYEVNVLSGVRDEHWAGVLCLCFRTTRRLRFSNHFNELVRRSSQ